METSFSDEFKKKFLFELTKELIIHSGKKDIIKLQNIIYSKESGLPEKESQVNISNEEIPKKKINEEFSEEINNFLIKKEEIKKQEELREKISVAPLKPIVHHFEEEKQAKEIPAQQTTNQKQQIQQRPPVQKRPARLFIPETRMPQSLDYLKPAFVENKTTTDWQKLNPLIKDNAVRTIEVTPDEKIIVSGSMGERTTNIILNNEEVNEIINKFSYVSRIPVSEGVYKVVVENLIFFAVISGVVGSRFVIQKIQPVQSSPYPSYQPRY
jgi:hypothetical protein